MVIQVHGSTYTWMHMPVPRRVHVYEYIDESLQTSENGSGLVTVTLQINGIERARI